MIDYFMKNMEIKTYGYNYTTAFLPTIGDHEIAIGGAMSVGQIRHLIKENIQSHLQFILDWGKNGLNNDPNNHSVSNLNADSLYYLGVKLITAEIADSYGIEGYRIVYPEGDIGWLPKEVFNTIYLKLGEVYNTLSPAIVDRFIVTTDTKWENKITTVKTKVITGFSFELNGEFEKNDIKYVVRDKMNSYLSFLMAWGQKGLKDVPPYNINLSLVFDRK
jgi:hypothetical protein